MTGDPRTDCLVVETDYVRYLDGDREVWAFPVAELRMFGEWTDCSGPYLDDYFYLFVAGDPPVLYEAPMYANHDLANVLGRALGAELQLGLVGSTDLASRIVWPPELKDQALFQYSDHDRGDRMVARLMDRVLPLVDVELSKEVAIYLSLETKGRTSA